MNNITKFVGLSLLGIMALSSCTQKDCLLTQKEKEMMVGSEAPLSFRTNILSSGMRVQNDAWEQGDQIGVYMLKAGVALNNATPADILYANKIYKTDAAGASGSFSAASEADKMFMPNDGTAVDFVAFYPQNLAVSSTYTIDVDVATQPAKDMLYTQTLKNANKTTEKSSLALNFSHVLSQLQLLLIDEAEKPITDVTATILGMNTTAKFNLGNGAMADVANPKDIAMAKGNANMLMANVLPTESMGDVKVKIKANGKNYTWKVAADKLLAGNAYKYTLKLLANGQVEVMFNGSTITGWVVVDGGVITVTPDKDPTPDPDPTPTPTKMLLFPGSDFENFDAFLGSLNKYKLQKYASAAAGQGRESSQALYINGTPGGNEYVFTAVVPNETAYLDGKTKIVFYIKGTSPKKTISINLYKNNSEYTVYNLGDKANNGTDVILTPEDKNAYIAAIDTKGQWVKVTLNIKGFAINKTAGENLFAIKAGSKSTYNLYIDDITIE